MLKSHIKGYQKRFKKYGVDARALQWQSKNAQNIRLKELVVNIDFEGKSVLDVGCGFGDLIPYIEKKIKNLAPYRTGAGFEYTGCDLVPEFIEVAKNKFTHYKFLITNYFDNPLDRKFDIVVTSGTLNANIKNPYEYRKKAIRLMWVNANEVVAFNMAGGHPQPRNKKGNRVYYADLNKVVDFCKTLTTKIIIRKDYSPNDFTIILNK